MHTQVKKLQASFIVTLEKSKADYMPFQRLQGECVESLTLLFKYEIIKNILE